MAASSNASATSQKPVLSAAVSSVPNDGGGMPCYLTLRVIGIALAAFAMAAAAAFFTPMLGLASTYTLAATIGAFVTTIALGILFCCRSCGDSRTSSAPKQNGTAPNAAALAAQAEKARKLKETEEARKKLQYVPSEFEACSDSDEKGKAEQEQQDIQARLLLEVEVQRKTREEEQAKAEAVVLPPPSSASVVAAGSAALNPNASSSISTSATQSNTKIPKRYTPGALSPDSSRRQQEASKVAAAAMASGAASGLKRSTNRTSVSLVADPLQQQQSPANTSAASPVEAHKVPTEKRSATNTLMGPPPPRLPKKKSLAQ